MKEKKIWTIGHSTHSIEVFFKMLASFDVQTLIDVRSLPGSRKFPQYDKEALEISATDNNIHYLHLKDLGGRRKPSRESKNTAWRLASFRGYADYMETKPFFDAVKHLELIASTSRTAYMCAEAVWWSCHRSLLSDYLKMNNWSVYHIMGVNKAQEHPYTKPARIEHGRLLYNSNGD